MELDVVLESGALRMVSSLEQGMNHRRRSSTLWGISIIIIIPLKGRAKGAALKLEVGFGQIKMSNVFANVKLVESRDLDIDKDLRMN